MFFTLAGNVFVQIRCNLYHWRNSMKIRANHKEVKDYRWITELSNYHRLKPEQLDIAIHGIPYEGKRYPLCYVFWGKSRHRQVYITLTKEVGTLIGENLIELPRTSIRRGIVKISDGRITDLSYSVIRFM